MFHFAGYPIFDSINQVLEKTIHQGRNIKRFREMLGIKQEALAVELSATHINTNNNHCSINYADRWVEAIDEIKKLYERLLQVEREKSELMQKILIK